MTDHDTDADPPEINGFGRAASAANVSKILEMRRARSTPAPALVECVECGGESGHRLGCSRDPARARPQPPAPPGPSAGKSRGKRLCPSCGKLVGAPGLRHKLDCPEYLGFGKVAPEPTPEPEPEPEPVVFVPETVPSGGPAGPPPGRTTEPDPAPLYHWYPPMPATQSPRLVAEPEPDTAPDLRPDGWPTVAALNALRSPRLPAVIRVLAKLDDDEAKWVLDALYRISREGRG